MTGPDHGASVNEWVNVVRRARLASTVKLVALMLASYANPDGSKVFPGVVRLSVQCECDYRTVRRALRKLRDVGLIEVARRGNHRAGKSDEYRLILAADLMDRLDVPSPDMERKLIEDLLERDRAGSRGRYHRTRQTREPIITGHQSPLSQVTGDPPPSIRPLHVNQPPYVANGVRTDLKVLELSTPRFLDEEEDQPRPASACSNPICRDGWIKLGINVRPCPTCRPRSPGGVP